MNKFYRAILDELAIRHGPHDEPGSMSAPALERQEEVRCCVGVLGLRFDKEDSSFDKAKWDATFQTLIRSKK